MKMTYRLLAGAAACISATLALAAPVVPHYFGADPAALVAAKTRYTTGEATARAAVQQLVNDAEAALKFAPVSVTQKTRRAPSGDPHDYMSTAPYFWPDPKKPDGLPYIRRDGKVNPESRTAASDHARLENLGDKVETLALAYYFTGREPYAAHAARLLRGWFLEPATKMNPNFNFAQGVPGGTTGRPAGMIEVGGLVDAADASGLLAGSPAWTEADEAALRGWCGEFLDWMRTSPLGREVSAGENNQATMSDLRAVRFALKVGRRDLARTILSEVGAKRVAGQIAPDGSQPHELTRTKSFSYSRLNLNGLTALADLGRLVDVDLWGFTTADGRSVRRAVDYLLPYAINPAQPWPHEQIADSNRGELAGLLWRTALATGDARYREAVTTLKVSPRSRLHLTLAPLRSPVSAP